MDQVNLNSFLKLAYFLDYRNPRFTFRVTPLDRAKYEGCSEQELVETGTALLKKAVAERFDPARQHAVPLSGGLDSRFILACLLEHVEASKLATFTFGSPGTLDYEIGGELARRFGTRHQAIPLPDYVYDLDMLIEMSKAFDHQARLFIGPPVREILKRYGDHLVWSGFLGGTLSGSHVPHNKAPTPEEGKRRFLARDTFVRSTRLTNIDDREMFRYLEYSGLDKTGGLSFEEQLDLENRQPKRIAPCVLHRGLEFRTPFADPAWMHFILSVPDRLRRNKTLYKHILLTAYPEAFRIRTKTSYGLPLDATPCRQAFARAGLRLTRAVSRLFPAITDPTVNFVDIVHATRERKDFRDLIRSSIMDLKHRGIVDWIDMEALWKRHADKRANHADALIVLASLEIHLKAGKIP